jgi:hypothetical protein
LLESLNLCFDVSAQSDYQRRVIRKADIDTLESYFGTTEKGYNRGKQIERIIRLGGGKVGQPYCSFGKKFTAKANNIPLRNIDGRAVSWYRWKAIKVFYGKTISSKKVKSGDVVLIPRDGGSGWHVETLRKWKMPKKNECMTGGFNTSSPYEHHSRKEGVFPHIRRKEYIIILDYEQFWNITDPQITDLCVHLNALFVMHRKQLQER